MSVLQLLLMLAIEFSDVIMFAVGIFLVAITGISGLVSTLLIAGKALPKI
jgi:hypothetical protein